MPHPKGYVKEGFTYVAGHVRKTKKSKRWNIWLILSLILLCGVLWMWLPWLCVSAAVFGAILYLGIAWLQWRIWKIDSDAKRNYWVYLLKGKSTK
jgi:hypothetical protein